MTIVAETVGIEAYLGDGPRLPPGVMLAGQINKAIALMAVLWMGGIILPRLSLQAVGLVAVPLTWIGVAVMIGLLTFVLLFTAGARIGYLLGGVLLAAPMAYLLIATSAYRMRRIEAFLEPFEHRYGIGYQIAESLMSFGAGGVSGVGIGDSRQKLFYLPEAHTDFISAIVGEELGFIGILFLLSTFVLIVVRGLRAAWRSPNDYGTYIAVGITMFVGLQAFTNLAVAMGMLPTKGLVLPFVSYGGSSLLVNCVAVGILLNVSRAREAVAHDAVSDAPATPDETKPRTKKETRRKTKQRNRRKGESVGAPVMARSTGGTT